MMNKFQLVLLYILFSILMCGNLCALSLPDNKVIFEKPRYLTLSIEYIDGKVTVGQNHSTFFDVSSQTEDEFVPSFQSQRKKSKEVADYFNSNTKVRINYHGGDEPKELNFAIKTQLTVKNIMSNNESQAIDNLYLAQGHTLIGGNDWWIGCKLDDCIQVSNKELIILTSNNEAYDIKTGSTNHDFVIVQDNVIDKLTFTSDSPEIKDIKLIIESAGKFENVEDIATNQRTSNHFELAVDHLELLKQEIAKVFVNSVKELTKYTFIESEEGQGGTTTPGKLYFYIKTKLYINGSPIVKFDESGETVDSSQIVDIYLGLGKSAVSGKNWWLGTSGRYIYRPTSFGGSRMLVKTQDGKIYIIQHKKSIKNTNVFNISPQPEQCEWEDQLPVYC